MKSMAQKISWSVLSNLNVPLAIVEWVVGIVKNGIELETILFSSTALSSSSPTTDFLC